MKRLPTHRNFRKEQILSNQARNQKRFHEHYVLNDHDGFVTGDHNNRPC